MWVIIFNCKTQTINNQHLTFRKLEALVKYRFISFIN